MEIHDVLLILGCMSCTVGICISAVLTYRKQRARTTLLIKLARDMEFLSEIHRLRGAHAIDESVIREEYEMITALISQRLKQLDFADRSRIETSLYQPSTVGRERYVGKLVSDAESRHETLCEAGT